jgi:prepilin-type N-terminal cleavage/methylation domain-containing protein
MSRKGMTLLEIIISMMILSLITVGIANVFLAAKKYVRFDRSRIVAAQLGRYYMDVLQLNVTAANWRTASNNLTAQAYLDFNDTINRNMNYTINRTVDYPFDPAMKIHRVKLTISWNETSS